MWQRLDRKIGLGLALLVMHGVAAAQAPSESTIEIFRDSNFKGGAITLSGPMLNIDPGITIRSVRITGPGAWELCSGYTYSGCKRFDSSIARGVFSVRSVRPVAPVVRVGPDASGTVEPIANRSLRGLASEYFVAPTRGDQRVAVPGNDGEAMRKAASEFCRAAGWRNSAFAQLQDAGGTYYLADVLCVNMP